MFLFSLVTSTSIWFLSLCLIAGAGYAFFLYYKNKSQLSRNLLLLLFFLRFFVVSMIAFFLLGPMLQRIQQTIEKPVVVIGLDHSASVLMTKDSTKAKASIQQGMEKLISELSGDFDVKTYAFGDRLSSGFNYKFKDEITDIESFAKEIQIRYGNRNLGAVIMASDGLFNRGENPLYPLLELNCPVYTVTMGDSTVYKDLMIAKTRHNKTVYSGNSFPVEIIVAATKLKGKQSRLILEENGSEIFSANIDINSQGYSLTVPVQVKAAQKGIMHLTAKLSPVPDEISLRNNISEIFIEVIDDKQKVLILADAPHPDIAALRQSLAKNEAYECDYADIKKFKGRIEDYHLIVLHQLPSIQNRNNPILNNLAKMSTPLLYIVGRNTDINALNQLQQICRLSPVRGKTNDAVPIFHKDFSLFSLDDDYQVLFNTLPPLQVPFGRHETGAGSSVLMHQKIGAVRTNEPLIVFSDAQEKKSGIILGEGIWKWRFYDYQQNNNHKMFDEFTGKVVKFLSVKEDKSPFRVNMPSIFNQNDPVTATAEVYDAASEMVTEAKVEIIITDEKGKSYQHTFTYNNQIYQLNTGILPVGLYRYNASCHLGGKLLKKTGQFTVKMLLPERLQATADLLLLKQIADKSGGKLYFPEQMSEIPVSMQKEEKISAVSYSEKKLTDLIDIEWLLFLLVCLLGIEWLVRKYNGGY